MRAAAAIDPTVLALLSGFGGVAVTVVAGFIGAWIQGRREHEKWMRELRYEAFVNVYGITDGVRTVRRELSRLETAADTEPESVALENVEALSDRLDGLKSAAASASLPFAILGPPSVDRALTQYLRAATEDDETAAERQLQIAMRDALKIK